MNTRKTSKLLALLLALVMVVGLMPTTTFAAGNSIFTAQPAGPAGGTSTKDYTISWGSNWGSATDKMYYYTIKVPMHLSPR